MESRGFALVVFTFDDENEARDALNALKNLEKAGRLSIDDSAVIRRAEDGKIHVDNTVDSSVKGGAAIGGMLGTDHRGDPVPDRWPDSRRGRWRGRRQDDGDRSRQEVRLRREQLAATRKLGALRHVERR